MINLVLPGRVTQHLRFGGGQIRFREKIQNWLNDNVGQHGTAWHVRPYRVDENGLMTYKIYMAKDRMIMFKLTWL